MAAMNMNREQFDEMIRSGKTFLVDYWAPWCGYCRKIEVAYEAVSETWGRSIPVAKISSFLTARALRSSPRWCFIRTERLPPRSGSRNPGT